VWYDLAWHLRRWWDEPRGVARAPADLRVRFLKEWVARQEATGPGPVGAKHPLLSLSGDDLAAAWGPGVRFVWAWRPLAESVAGLCRRNWFGDAAEPLQRRLWDALLEFEARRRDVVRLDWARVRADPRAAARELAGLACLAVSDERVREAARFVRTEPVSVPGRPVGSAADPDLLIGCPSPMHDLRSPPAVSVVMPVYNGARFVGRAVASLRAQTRPDWELLAVDDGSADDSAAVLDALAAADPRVRVFRHPANRGLAAARNTALAAARGDLVAYLDCDDEFYPDHLARAVEHAPRAEVLLFRYDLVEERPGAPGYGTTATYDPAARRDLLFAETISSPLGVVHRRALLARAGAFDEALGRYRGQDEDGDLWRRFARAGATFAAVPHASGRYHVRPDSLVRTRPAPPPPAAGPDPRLCFVTVCMGRLGHLRRTLPAALAQPGCRVVVVDYSCPDGCGDWVERHHPQAAVIRVPGRSEFNLAAGRNAGARAADASWLCFLDADVAVAPDFARTFFPLLAPGGYYRPDPTPNGTAGTVAVARTDFDRAGGYDECYRGYGCEDGDLYAALGLGGVAARTFPGRLLTHLDHPDADRTRHYEAKDLWESVAVGRVYHRVKFDLAGRAGRPLPPAAREGIYAVVRPAVRAWWAAGRTGPLEVTVPVPGGTQRLTYGFDGATLGGPARLPKPVRPVPPPADTPAVAPGVPARPPAPPRVLFASYHCYHDPASGAAVCTGDLFAALAARGWRCGAFTGPALDDPAAAPVRSALGDMPGARTRRGAAGPVAFTVHTGLGPGGFPVTVFDPDPPAAARPPTAAEAAAFRAVLGEVLARFRPDVVLTYGGDPASAAVAAAARRAGARVAFWLHNFAYPDRAAFAGCDAVVVPSEFSRAYHRGWLGQECVALPPVIDPARVATDRPGGGACLTFVNPVPEKGVFVYARLAEALGRARPDVPLLVVEGRGRADWLGRCGVDLSGVTSFRRVANTPDPRQFYRLTRLVVMPSVWRESFGRVAAEAMLNGIPVVASDRGALPEVVGPGGVCLPVPAHVTPETRLAPAAAEVAPWVAAVLRLWDDPAAYTQASAAARSAAAVWHPDAVVPRWEAFLTALAARG
jgi:glycosyltransferase involved in cell wall biosynthesis